MTADPDTPEAGLRAFCDAVEIPYARGDLRPRASDIRAVLDRLARAEEAGREWLDARATTSDMAAFDWNRLAEAEARLAAALRGKDAP